MTKSQAHTVEARGVRINPAGRDGPALAFSPRDRTYVAIVAVLGILPRAVLLFAVQPQLTPDSPSYLALAHRLGEFSLAGNPGYRTPGYPLLLLAVGYSPFAAWVLQAALGVVTSILIYRLIRRLGGNPTAALLGGGSYAFNLSVVAAERQVMTETLTTFLLAVTVSLWLDIVRNRLPSARAAVPLCVTIFCLCLTRPDQFVVVVWLGVLLLALARWRSFISQEASISVRRIGLAVILSGTLTLAGWASVNWATIGIFTISTVAGHNMVDHVAPYVRVSPGPDHGLEVAYVAARSRLAAKGIKYNVSWAADPAMEKASHLNAAHVSQRLLGLGLDTIRANLWPYIRSSLGQVPEFWKVPDYGLTLSSHVSPLLHLVIKAQRRLNELIAACFLCLFAATGISRLALRRGSWMEVDHWILAGVAFVGLIPACFLAYGDTGRYGYVYFPIVVAISFSVGGRFLARCWAQARHRRQEGWLL